MTTAEPQNRNYISFEAAILLFGILSASSDKQLVGRAVKLGLRGPDVIKTRLETWLQSLGIDPKVALGEEPIESVSRAEVKDLAEFPLKQGADMAAMAQIFDIYIFGKERTPENIVYAFYIGTRFTFVRDREPTKEEIKRIWDITLEIARSSRIGAPHWQELESRGDVYLKDWLDTCKENARKRYETFLNQKNRAQAAAREALTFIMSDLFAEQENDNPIKANQVSQ
jgi:hypothetical protein